MLRDLQAAFRHALATPDMTAHPARLGGAHLVAHDRFWIYRNNFLASLTSALEAAFPTVARLVGEDNFRVAAHGFVRAHPPEAPSLYAYGEGFPDHLAGLSEAVADFPFLSDLARLEWAVNEAYFAADSAPLTPEGLAAIDPADYAGLRLALRPAARLVWSSWPIWDLWDAEAAPEPGGSAPLEGGPHHVLVLRRDGKVDVILLSPGDFTFVAGLEAGLPLADAAAEAAETEPDYDLTAALGAHLQRGTFAEPGTGTGGAGTGSVRAN